jgi:hypothetical protein
MEWLRLHSRVPRLRQLLKVGSFFSQGTNELKQGMMLWAMSAIFKETPQLNLRPAPARRQVRFVDDKRVPINGISCQEPPVPVWTCV